MGREDLVCRFTTLGSGEYLSGLVNGTSHRGTVLGGADVSSGRNRPSAYSATVDNKDIGVTTQMRIDNAVNAAVRDEDFANRIVGHLRVHKVIAENQDTGAWSKVIATELAKWSPWEKIETLTAVVTRAVQKMLP